MSLHPRAVRMGLERVIEHQRVALKETPLLTELYDNWLVPEQQAKPLNQKQIKDFLKRENKAEQEDWVQDLFKFSGTTFSG